MRMMILKALSTLGGLLLLAGCTTPVQPYDYTAYHASNPASVLILPPVNHSPDVKASYSVLTHLSQPLAMAGYYVMPVAVVDETFKHNGLTTPESTQEVPANKLHAIFGSDAALYVTIEQYGTSYRVFQSATAVTVTARLVDLRTGTLLWDGKGSASTAEKQSTNTSLLGMLVQAAVTQVAESMQESGHDVAKTAGARLLNPYRTNGILPGPYLPTNGKDKPTS